MRILSSAGSSEDARCSLNWPGHVSLVVMGGTQSSVTPCRQDAGRRLCQLSCRKLTVPQETAAAHLETLILTHTHTLCTLSTSAALSPLLCKSLQSSVSPGRGACDDDLGNEASLSFLLICCTNKNVSWFSFLSFKHQKKLQYENQVSRLLEFLCFECLMLLEGPEISLQHQFIHSPFFHSPNSVNMQVFRL